MKQISNNDQLIFDIYRSKLLSLYINEWGQPLNRTIFKNENNVDDIEIYVFPSNSEDNVSHVVSIGIGITQNNKNHPVCCEYFFTLPDEFLKINEDDVVDYLASIAIHLTTNYSTAEVKIINEILIAPNSFSKKAILEQEALGESEELSKIEIFDNFNVVCLRWLVPIYETEANFILKYGIEEFDRIYESYDFSLVDTSRPPVI